MSLTKDDVAELLAAAQYLKLVHTAEAAHYSRMLAGIAKKELAAAPAPSDALSQSIAADAQAFEATLDYKPTRTGAASYPWGWCYASNEVQNKFKDFCTARKHK